MNDFLNWLKEYPLYAVGLVGVIIVFLIVLRFAGKAYTRYYERYRKEEAEIKRLVALKEKYRVLTEDLIKNADNSELLEGVALSFQLKLQKEEKQEEMFSSFAKEIQYAYALDVFCGENQIRDFFRENGDILKDIIIPAFSVIGLEKEGEMLLPLKLMYDENDSTTSFSEGKIKEIEDYFQKNNILTKIKEKGAEYIKDNVSAFVS